MSPHQPITTAMWLQQTAAALMPLAGLDVAISDVRLEARRLLGDVLDITPTALQMRLNDLLSDAELALLADALQRRLNGEPLAYITGRWWFWDLELEVAPCTLIPRPDTELLVEQALSLALPANANVLDLGMALRRARVPLTALIPLNIPAKTKQFQCWNLHSRSGPIRFPWTSWR